MKTTDSQMLPLSKVRQNNGQIAGLPKNPRLIKGDRFEKLKASIAAFPEMLSLREIVVFPFGETFVCLGGNMRYLACRDLGYKDIPAKVLPADFPVDKLAEFVIKDNVPFGENDWDILANEWSELPLEAWGMDDLAFLSDDLTDDFSLPDGDKPGFRQMTFTLSDEQAEVVDAAIAKAAGSGPFIDTGNENRNGNALARICEMYA